jgi:hypothetical protein
MLDGMKNCAAGGIEFDHRRRQRAGIQLAFQHVLPIEDEHVVLSVDAGATEATDDPFTGQRLRPSRIDLELRNARLRPQ